MLLPSSAANPATMVAQALTMYKSLVSNAPENHGSSPQSSGVKEITDQVSTAPKKENTK